MTRAEIAAELRRSACEDFDPFMGVAITAFRSAIDYERLNETLHPKECSAEMIRLFYLLVAEAL